jgi:hypothetical protein
MLGEPAPLGQAPLFRRERRVARRLFSAAGGTGIAATSAARVHRGARRQTQGMDRFPWAPLAVAVLFTSLACRGLDGAAPPSERVDLAAPAPAAAVQRAEFEELVEQVLALYRAFDFEAGAEPDWEAQRSLALNGATFVGPVAPGQQLSGEGIEPFIEGFRAYATSKRMGATGLYERVTHVQGQLFGGIAQLFVTFEGHLPGATDRLTHGVDGLSFVRSAGEWRLVSFTSQYENGDLRIPESFETLQWSPQR